MALVRQFLSVQAGLCTKPNLTDHPEKKKNHIRPVLKGVGPEPRARNYWVSGFLGHPKMVRETQILEQIFRLETQGLSG